MPQGECEHAVSALGGFGIHDADELAPLGGLAGLAKAVAAMPTGYAVALSGLRVLHDSTRSAIVPAVEASATLDDLGEGLA